MEPRNAAGADALAHVRSANLVRELLDATEGAEVTSCDEDVHVVGKLTGRGDVEAAEVDVGEVELRGPVGVVDGAHDGKERPEEEEGET